MGNMLKVSAFRGVRFDPRRVRLSRAICPPYDVISEALARKLRRNPGNAIHIELPAGAGAERYLNARRTWNRWLEKGVLLRDERPAFYVVEQGFRLGGKPRRRVGLLAALGLDAASARRVLPHEKTLSKPKKDRTRLLKALQVNTSPIFGIFTDPDRAISRILDKARRARPLARGRDAQGVSCRLWRVDGDQDVRALERAFRGKSLLIADGHHRYEVARAYGKKNKAPGASAILAYLCAEEDSGLVVLPTHRVLRLSEDVKRALAERCVARPMSGLKALNRALDVQASPYAFGLCNGRFQLMLPARGDSGVRSRFGTAWLAERILGSVDAHDMSYFHDAESAAREARLSGAAALIVKPFPVSAIRQAVRRAGLLPQKSTYFYPKIGTGLVFRPLKPLI